MKSLLITLLLLLSINFKILASLLPKDMARSGAIILRAKNQNKLFLLVQNFSLSFIHLYI